jgi:hypothetical protein
MAGPALRARGRRRRPPAATPLAALAALAALAVGIVPAAAARHLQPTGAIAGARYTGLAADGATITLSISPDGTLVDAYEISGARTKTCILVGQGMPGVWPGAPISAGSFSSTQGSSSLLKGTFTGARSASGTFRLALPATPEDRACTSGSVNWTATTTSRGSTVAGSDATAASVRLRALSATRVTGRIGSSRPACRRRRVVLWHGSARVAVTTSRPSGAFSFVAPRPWSGPLRASAPARAASGCAPASSVFIEAPAA